MNAKLTLVQNTTAALQQKQNHGKAIIRVHLNVIWEEYEMRGREVSFVPCGGGNKVVCVCVCVRVQCTYRKHHIPSPTRTLGSHTV